MDFLSLFLKKNFVVGIEINQNAVRAVIIDDGKGKFPKKIIFQNEKLLRAGVIAGGALSNSKELSEALRLLCAEMPVRDCCAVISIPDERVYTKLISFPIRLVGRNLDEAISLACDFQLPFKSGENYHGFQAIASNDRRLFFIAAIQKSVADAYIESAYSAGIKAVALEFHSLSIARIIDTGEKAATIVTREDGASLIISVIKNGELRLNCALEKTALQQSSIARETQKIAEFYEVEYEAISKTLPLTKIPLQSDYKKHFAEQSSAFKWFPALGAGARASLARSVDPFLTLLPVDPAHMYRYQKKVAFISFLSKITLGVGFIITAAFLGVWILLIALQERSLAPEESVSLIPQNLKTAEDQIRSANNFLETASRLFDKSPNWAPLIQDFHSRIPVGIIVTSVTFPSPDDHFSISGVAKTRGDLQILKKNLETSEFLTDVAIPLTNLELKQDIPFSLTMQLENKERLYQAQ